MMAAIPPRTSVEGFKKSIMDGIDGVFNRGVKHGRYLALQEYCEVKRKLSECEKQLENRVCETMKMHPKWTSVKDELPKKGEMVLANTLYFYEVLQWDERTDLWMGISYVRAKDYVTHWMPLPEPPREDAH